MADNEPDHLQPLEPIESLPSPLEGPAPAVRTAPYASAGGEPRWAQTRASDRTGTGSSAGGPRPFPDFVDEPDTYYDHR
jgi:hypothetical protein